jgi:hypothetical protein
MKDRMPETGDLLDLEHLCFSGFCQILTSDKRIADAVSDANGNLRHWVIPGGKPENFEPLFETLRDISSEWKLRARLDTPR